MEPVVISIAIGPDGVKIGSNLVERPLELLGWLRVVEMAILKSLQGTEAPQVQAPNLIVPRVMPKGLS